MIVVEQPDGTLLSTPFHVRFGRYGVFNADDKVIDIQINEEEIDLKMRSVYLTNIHLSSVNMSI